MPERIVIAMFACCRCRKRYAKKVHAEICEFHHDKPPFRQGDPVSVLTMLGVERRRITGKPGVGLPKEVLFGSCFASDTIRPAARRPAFEWYFEVDDWVPMAECWRSRVVPESICRGRSSKNSASTRRKE